MMIEFLKAFFGIFVVMDTLGNLPVFFTFMKAVPAAKKIEVSRQAIVLAGAVLFLFLFFGYHLLTFFNIDFNSFKVAGGIIVLIFGLKLVLGFKIPEEHSHGSKTALVPLATPLITGPATITTIMIFSFQYGFLLTILASLLNLYVAYFSLVRVDRLHKILGHQGSDALSKIMGLVLTAIGVGFIQQGWI
jgi:multiple antibiotic resistance protein